MHILQDENGNPIPHGHEAGQEHCHNHEANHEHCHMHHHDHDGQTEPPMTALLDYMLKHNQSHAKELVDLAAKLSAAGKEAAAQQIRTAVDEFQKGNLYLSLALASLKEE